MKKPIVLVLILFAFYSLGVVFYYNQDQIKTELNSALSTLETKIKQQEASENVTETSGVEAKDIGTIKDGSGNEVPDSTPVVVSPSNNDISKVFDTPVDSSRSTKIPLQSMLQNNLFKNAVTLAFMLFALMQWINYAANFSPNNALKEVIVPAMATFLAVHWDKVISWFMVGL